MTMKKTRTIALAFLAALLALVQAAPVLAGTYSSGIVVGGAQGFRETMEIIASRGTYVLVGQTLEMDVNEGYSPEWKSDNEEIAVIDENGVLEALAAGEVTVTATEGEYSASVTVTVIDPEPLMEAAQQQETAEPEPAAEPSGEPTPEGPAPKQYAIIVINGENARHVYDGTEHELDTFVATSNQEFFDASKVRVAGEIGVRATDCGTYAFNLDESAFSYDDPDVVASFVVNSGWMKITPAQVTVSANPAAKQAGEADPELTATVEGLAGGDTVAYDLERYPGEEPGEYIIDVYGEEKQGNYKVRYVPGILTVTEAPAEPEPEPLEVSIRCLHPAGEPVEYGMEITLVAEVTGAAEGEYTIRWQYSGDMVHWTDIPGADSLAYTFEANGETVTYAWRAVADRIR